MTVTEKQIAAKVRALVKKYPTATAAAKALKVTNAQISEAVNQKRVPCPALLKAIGVERVTVFRSRK